MAGLSLKHICKIYPNGFQAVRDFNLEIEEPEFVVLTGPAGCGKTTLLKVIAGLEEATSGKVLVDGQDVTDADPRDRQLAMLFKNSTLYPGMTVYENMAFALRMTRMPQSEIDERVTEASELLGLSGILSAMPETLSEMDERRVLLGRAIVRRPKVLLMDSVLSGISVKPLVKFQKLYEKLGIIIVYVTSDPRRPWRSAHASLPWRADASARRGRRRSFTKTRAALMWPAFLGHMRRTCLL